MQKVVVCLLAALVLSACQYATQNRYNYSEVGQIQVVNFGRVVKVRDIDITGKTSGLFAVAGGAGGAIAGAHVGAGSGALMGAVGGAVIGIIAGSALEQAIRNRGGVEYTVILRNGKVLTVAQNIGDKDIIHEINDRVMVQINGEYQRVLPANDIPTEVEKPEGIKFKNE
tara:strand:+ start:319 stop:828 length:510 start_codon:yes stop_codon:yes gene_type:complete